MDWKTTAAATLATALAAPVARAQQGTGPEWGHGHWDGPWHGWFMGPIAMLAFLVLVAAVVVLIIRWLGAATGPRDTGRPHEALDILKERFARGEIDEAEFEERRKVLRD